MSTTSNPLHDTNISSLEEGTLHQEPSPSSTQNSHLRHTSLPSKSRSTFLQDPLLNNNKTTRPRALSNPEASTSTKRSSHSISLKSTFKSYLESVVPIPLLKRTSTGRTHSVPLFLCAICLENHAITDSFSLESCTAQHRFCTDSMTMYLSSLIKEGAVLSLKCPCFGMDGCDAVFSKEEVNKLVDDSCFEQYSRLLEIKTNPNARECPTCSHFSTSGSEENPEMKCEGCGTVFCYLHNNAHPEISCQEYVRRTAKTDLWSTATIKATSRKCPQCKAPTQKSSGCNHMTCQHCRADWCWLCGREIESDHYDGFSTCTGQQFSPAPPLVLWGVCPCLRWNIVFYLRTLIYYLYLFAFGVTMLAVFVASLGLSLALFPLIYCCLTVCGNSEEMDCGAALVPSYAVTALVGGAIMLCLNLAYLPIPIVVTLFRLMINCCDCEYDYFPHEDAVDVESLYYLWFYPVYTIFAIMNDDDD